MKCLIVSILLICLIGCSNGQVLEKYEIMRQRRINFPISLMEKVYTSLYPDTLQENKKFKLVVYLDSLSCSSCKISQFENWKNKFENRNSISVITIIDAKGQYKKSIYNDLCAKKIGFAIYFDTLGIFHKQNPQIPNEEMFHTFLLNEHDSVVLVGDPTKNQKIEELLVKTIESFN